MRTSLVPAALTIAVLLAAPAAAQQGATSVAAPAKPEKLVCKTSTPIGSMIPSRRECHTRAEWNEMAQNARTAAGEMMDRRASSTPSGQ